MVFVVSMDGTCGTVCVSSLEGVQGFLFLCGVWWGKRRMRKFSGLKGHMYQIRHIALFFTRS